MFIRIFSHRSEVSNFDIILIYFVSLQTHMQYMYIKIECLKYFDYTEMPKIWVIFLE